MYERRYNLADSAMEVFLKTREAIMFNFVAAEGKHSAKRFRNKIMKAIASRQSSLNPLTILGSTIVGTQLVRATA